MKPIARLGGPVEYAKIGELFQLEIPDPDALLENRPKK
jgi:hypothetical protein